MGSLEHLPYVIEADGFAMERFATLEEAKHSLATRDIYKRPGLTARIVVWAPKKDRTSPWTAVSPTVWDHVKTGLLPDD